MDEDIEYVDADYFVDPNPSIEIDRERYHLFLRDLDTITEVSENSCSSAFRSWHADQANTTFGLGPPYAFAEMHSERTDMLSPNRVEPTLITSRLQNEQERRFLLAYQQYHQPEDDSDECSSEPSLSCSVSDSTPGQSAECDQNGAGSTAEPGKRSKNSLGPGFNSSLASSFALFC